MSHLQYMPGDPHLIDQLVYELKSKGIFDQFRKDCIADVDTRPAYQNLRQRVESSVTTFLSRQKWKPDLNKNQLREKLRKHILDGNYLEQGVERIVDQVVNPKVASVFIPQVEDLVYNYFGIKRVKTTSQAETSNEKDENIDLLPTDLEAVSPGSVKSEKDEPMETDDIEVEKMVTEESKLVVKEDENTTEVPEKTKEETETSEPTSQDCYSVDNSTIPLPAEIKPEDIPLPNDSPPKFDLQNIELPNDSEIPLPKIPLPDIVNEEIPLPDSDDKENYFKPINHSYDDDSSSDSSIIRNMSPLTPVRNFDDENSCDAQQGFDNNTEVKQEDVKEPSNNTFKFSLESIDKAKEENNTTEKKEDLSLQFETQVNINATNTPMYDESSNSNNLQIDYESDANSKLNAESKQENSDSKKDRSSEKKSHKSSHHSRDSHRHSSSSKRSDSKYSSSRDRKDSKNDKKSSKDGHSSKSKSSHRERSRDRSDKKDSRDSSRHRHSSSHKSSKDSKSKSSSSQRQSSSKHSDDKKSSSSSSHRDRSDKSSSKDHKSSRDSKSSSHRSDKDRKSSSSRSKEDKDKERKEKKEQDDHYSLSGRGNISRRSTDRDSNDGNSSSSKGSNNIQATKTAETKKDKSSSKSENTTSSSDSTSPGDKEIVDNKTDQAKDLTQVKPVIRVENHLETPISKSPMRFMPEVVLKKPKFASNLEEAKKMMKMRKFLDEEQRRMNQEAALLLEFQANVRPSLSQVYSSIPGPELEFACVNNSHEEENNHQEESIKEKEGEKAVTNENKNQDQEDSGEETIESIFEIQKEIDRHSDVQEQIKEVSEPENKKLTEFYEVTVVAEELSEIEDDAASVIEDENKESDESTNMTIAENAEQKINERARQKVDLKYFDVKEKYESTQIKDKFSTFFKNYTEKCATNKLFLINCNSYHTNLIREAAEIFGNFDIVSYTRNGHLKLPKANKNIDFDNKEVILPLMKSPNKCAIASEIRSPLFSPVKSECSFELSSDYDDKLKNMANTTSRQEIMEIILGSVLDESPPKIDICNESNIEHCVGAKRKLSEDENDNNNEQIIIPNKVRKTSCSDQISSTTEESEVISSTQSTNVVRSKYLGKARRVGLPKPKRNVTPNSPSSDRSVENYEQTTVISKTLNGKLKSQRNKVQRYDTSDLYKPKLPFLSRRNHVT